MSAALRVGWLRFRATFGRRLGGYAAIVLLIGLVGGLAIGAIAGARRTQSSFPAFLASTQPSDITVAILGGADDPRLIRAIEGLPHVRRVERGAFANIAKLGPKGKFVGAGPAGVGQIDSVDGEYFTQDRLAVLEGRMADPKRPDEMVMTADAARLLRWHIGQMVTFGFYTNAQTDATGQGVPTVKPQFTMMIKVVGIVVPSTALIQDDSDRNPTFVYFTPALNRRVEACPTSCLAGYSIAYLQVAGGARNVAAVERELEAVLPKNYPPMFSLMSTVETHAETAIKPESIALGVFGVIAALAALFIAGQVIGRQLRFGGDDLDTLRALGAGPAVTATDGLIGTVGAIVIGSAFAVAFAVGLSPFAPIGLVRRVYPSRGIAFDWTVLGVGALGLIVALTALAAVIAVRQAPHRVARRGRRTATRGSRVAHAAGASGMPVPAVAGIRFALEPGRGRNTVPVRSALAATALAVMIVVTTLIFGSSLDSLVSHPALYGWNWTYALQTGNGGPIPPQSRAALDHDHDIATWTPVDPIPLVHIDALSVPALSGQPNATLTPPILSGHALNGADEVILGTTTLARLHKHVGDTVSVSYGRPEDAPLWIPPVSVRVVGTATMPTIGVGIGSQHTTMSTAAMFSSVPGEAPLLRAGQQSQGALAGPQMIWVQLRRGADLGAAFARLRRIADTANVNTTMIDSDWHMTVLSVQRPAEIVNYRSMGNTPAFLAGALALGAVVALALTLTASVRRRRRDLALLKTLGFTHRQLVATVAIQATVAAIVGTVIGVPVGILLGRQLWIQFAREISAVPQPTVAALTIIFVAIGALVLANLVAAMPGLRAARTPTAVLLHAE